MRIVAQKRRWMNTLAVERISEMTFDEFLKICPVPPVKLNSPYYNNVADSGAYLANKSKGIDNYALEDNGRWFNVQAWVISKEYYAPFARSTLKLEAI